LLSFSLPDIGNQKPGFSLAKAFLVLQNARKAAMRLVQTAKNLVSLPVSGSEAQFDYPLGEEVVPLVAKFRRERPALWPPVGQLGIECGHLS